MKIWTVLFGEPCHAVESYATELMAMKRAFHLIDSYINSYGNEVPQVVISAYKTLVQLGKYDCALELYRHFKKNVNVMESDLTGHVME